MSRWKRGLLWAALGAGVLILVLVLAAAWLLGSESGARFALARALAALPADSLSWQAQQGSLAQGLRLQGLRYQQDGLSVEIERIEVRARLIETLSSRLRVESLDIEGVQLTLPASEPEVEPSAPFTIELPESLPDLVLSLGIDVRRAEVRRLLIQRVAMQAPEAAADPAPQPAFEPVFEADRVAFVAALEKGRLTLTDLRLEAALAQLQAEGSIDTVQEWQSVLRLQGEWRSGLEQPQPFTVTVDGGLPSMSLQVRLPDAPEFALDLGMSGGLPRPDWQLDLRAPAAPPAFAAQWPAALSEVSLQGEGALDRAELSGGFVIDGRRYVLESASVRTDGTTLHVDAMRLAEGEGRADLAGWLRLAEADTPAASSFDLQLNLQRFDLPLAEAPPLRVDGELSARGAFDDAELDVALSLARGELAGDLRGGVQVQEQTARLQALELRTDEGRVRIDGELDWSEGLAWQIEAALADFDAGLLSPELPSRLSARIVSNGAEGEGLRRGELRLQGLTGELRGQPVRGEIDARWNGLAQTADAVLPIESAEADLDLRWGESALAGSVALTDRLQAQLDLRPLKLDGLAEGYTGELVGRLRLSGTAQAPRLAVDLQSPALLAQGVHLDEFKLQGELGLAANAPLQVQAAAAQVRLDERKLGALTLSLRGNVDAHALELRQEVDAGGLLLELSGGWRDAEQRWLGRLQQLDWRSPGRRAAAGDWQLAEAVALELGAQRIRVDTLCLEGRRRWGGATATASNETQTPGDATPGRPTPGDGGGRRLGSLCASVEGSGADDLQARLQLDSVPLAFPMGLVFEDSGLQRPRWQGNIEGEVELVARGPQWRANGRIRLPEGALRMGDADGRELLQWSGLALDIEGDQSRLDVQVGGAFGGGGRIDGSLVALGLGSDDAQLQGRLSLLLDQLGVLEFLSEEAVIAPVGRLSVEVEIDGPLAAPALQGGAALSGFSAEIPALGITPSEGRVDLRLDGSSAARIELGFRSGGELTGSGRLDWSQDAAIPLRLSIQGQDVLLSDTAQIQLFASPDLQLEQRGDLLRLRGQVQIPRAEVRLDRFEGSEQVSADVVVLDPAQPEQMAAVAQRVDADVRLSLGEDVKLEGFGLTGTVSGDLRVRDRPGRDTNASGSLNVGGRYKAYGQDLDITRGRLSFAQSPLDNPGLDIRAERRIEDVTVGIRVTGTAAAPVLSLWSQPSLDQADVLSYLVLGRPVRAARGGESQQLNAAAAALGAGGNFIAERLGARLGFDQASVEESAALGGAALTLGKYLSPRLYVAYGVALFGEGQVFSIKYLLTEQWDLQVEATQRETRGSVNYRLER